MVLILFEQKTVSLTFLNKSNFLQNALTRRKEAIERIFPYYVSSTRESSLFLRYYIREELYAVAQFLHEAALENGESDCCGNAACGEDFDCFVEVSRPGKF